MVNTKYNSTKDKMNKLQELKGERKFKIYKNMSNFYNEMKHFSNSTRSFARNAQGISKNYHEVLLCNEIFVD